MPRIYKPVGPSDNKGLSPVKETKTPPKPAEGSKGKETGGGGQ